METTNPLDLNWVELNRAQISSILGFSANKIASYNATEGRWLAFFPRSDVSRGRYRYYSVPDAIVMGMLVDTMQSKESGLSQPVGVEFRRGFASEIRRLVPELLVSGARDVLVEATVGRVSTAYMPRWDILDVDYGRMFDLPPHPE
jgi:hypothetical protein